MTFSVFSDSLAHPFYDTIFDPDATLHDLVGIVICLAASWAVVFAVICSLFDMICGHSDWLRVAAVNDYHRHGKAMNEKFGLKQTEQEFVYFFRFQWPWLQCVVLQHFVGGMLCLPSVLGLMDNDTASSIACLGVLSEIGWELSDSLSWLYKRFFTANGACKAPTLLLVVLGIHHSFSSCLGIPAVLFFRTFKPLHWLCFELQAAAAIALFVQEYTKLLDVSKPSQLFQFQAMTLFALITMFVTRVVHFPLLCYEFAKVWYEQEEWVMLGAALSLSTLFFLFSFAVCIQPCYQRFQKFLDVSAEYQKMPPAQKRASMFKLQSAALEVLQTDADLEDLANLLVMSRPATERRKTLPASMFGKSRRSSLTLLRASVGADVRSLRRASFLGAKKEN